MPTFDVSKLEVRPIVPNPGGQIDPGDHIGHGDEYELLKTATDGRGALLTGDRRMGKSSMLNVIEAVLRDAGHQVVRVSAETQYFETFASRLQSQVAARPFGREIKAWSLDVDVKKYGIHLRRDATKKEPAAVDEFWDWAVRKAAPDRLFVILDEITVLAYHIQRQQPGGGAELLRSLKRARDLPNGPIMIFAGSIGLHHALADLSVLGGMARIPIGPLKRLDAHYLARCLIAGASIDVDDAEAAAVSMVDATDGIAFYLHHLANFCRLHPGTVTADVVTEITTRAITSPDDPWELRHYNDRIEPYYGDDAAKVRWILDSLATAPGAPAIEALTQTLQTQPFATNSDRDEVGQLLDRLECDHYIVRSHTTGQFASRLLKRAWLHIRRLDAGQ